MPRVPDGSACVNAVNSDAQTGDSLPTKRPVADQATIEARIESLPKGLRNYVYDSGILPDLSRRAFLTRAQQAKRLADVIGGEFEVAFRPSAMFEDDIEATGNLFIVRLDNMLDHRPGEMLLDARQPDLRGQLAAEMRRVAAHYIGAAVALESTLPGKEEGGAA